MDDHRINTINNIWPWAIWLVPGLLLLIPYGMFSQTVNTGGLYVAPGTQFSTVGDFNNTATATFVNDGEAFIYGHFNNDGNVDFTSGETGYTRFEGTAIQQLSGGNISYFYDVLFNNTSNNMAAFKLSSEISIENEADFYEGIVETGKGLVIFENDATHSNTYGGSHVDGIVQKNGNTDFELPVGDGQYFRYAAISAPNRNDDVFTGKYCLENSNTTYPHTNRTGIIELIDDTEYWIINRNSGNSAVMVTLSWNSETTPEAITAQPLEDNLHIVRWDAASDLWVDEGGVVDATNNTVTSLVEVETFGVFTLARVKSKFLLPSDVVPYNAVSPNGNGKNDYFVIDNIQNLPNNRVEVFNHWGVSVFITEDYDTDGNVFNGYSDTKSTFNAGSLLPTGTYFYVISYDHTSNGKTERVKKSGYLYLSTD